MRPLSSIQSILSYVCLLVLVTAVLAAEEYAFKAEVNKMMDIIIHSLYKTKEIFLRELISNGSDALDKLRLLSLQNTSLVASDWQYNITIRPEPALRQLIIKDSGVGMTKEELLNNLGTIAKSGTKDFVEAFSKKQLDTDQIGQFGVGFYSAFLVADQVTVISKSPNTEKYVWTCNITQGRFSIQEAVGNEDELEPIGKQGTQIILHLKPDVDDMDYLSEKVLTELIQRYSQFINFPIFLFSNTSTTEQVPLEAAEDDEKEPAPDQDKDKLKVEDVVEDDAKDKLPKTKTVTTYNAKYLLINNNKPIWTRDPKNVTDVEYNEFYKVFAKDSSNPLAHSHFVAEGIKSDFRVLIYIPKKASFNAFSKDDPSKYLSLFVKRVFITDEFHTIFPRYMAFIKAIVDADEIPLNVSREMLQKHKMLTMIKNRVVSKTLSLIAKMSKDATLYKEFYDQFSNHLKLGILSDEDNKLTIAALLRFHSSATNNLTSFDDYIERMALKPNQTDIYFVTGSNIKELKVLPYVERALKRGYEVLYMTEPFDEYMIQALSSYNSHTLRNLAKSGVSLADDSESDKKLRETEAERFKPLTSYIQKLFSNKIETVVISSLLDESPMAIVSNQFGYSPAMERLMKGAKNDPMAAFFGSQKKIIEINPNHPLMKGLLDQFDHDATPSKAMEADLRLLYDAAWLHSGYELDDPATFAHRIEDMIRAKYGVAPMPESSLVSEPDEEAFPDFMNMAQGGNFDGFQDQDLNAELPEAGKDEL